MRFQAIDFMKRFRSEITLAAMRTRDRRHIFDDEQMLPLSVRSYNIPVLRSVLSANITFHRLVHLFDKDKNTVIITNFPVRLSFPMTSVLYPFIEDPVILYFHSAVSASF
jgi:hypothetical protein